MGAEILPWQNMVEVIELFYPKVGNGDLIRWKPCYVHSLHVALVQPERWRMEDALYEIAPCVCLPGYPWIAPCRDRTTIMNFRHLA